mgnify:FL=1|jgi:hypothetical protein|tara:strand:- start:87 stop:497 length:411 start_codon:yes stop_codon:yes gene_type:complete
MKDQKKSIQQTYSLNPNQTRIAIDPTLDTITEVNKEGENERALFRAVIYQALLDASNENENVSKESVQVREEAVRWFSKSVGVTATWFVDVCDLAGLNYQQVRSFARKLINDPDNTEFQRKRLNVLLNMTHKEEAK